MLDKERVLNELEIDEASLNAIPETVVKKKTELVGHFAAIDETVKLDDGEFSLKFIESDGNETMIYINPDEHEQLFIHMDEKYKLVCEEKNGHVYAKKVCPRKPTNIQERQKHAEKLDNIAKICSFSDDVPLPLMLGRRDKRVLLELNIEGKAKQLEDTDNTTKFVLSTDKRNFECVIVNNLMLPNVPLKLEENVSYLFRGYLASDGIFYVTGSDKEYTMELVYTNIPKELISDFRQLSLRQKEEILNLYEFYTHPDKKVEVLPSMGFFSVSEYTLKYRLLKAFIPNAISKTIEKQIADKTAKDKHKIDILRNFLDTVYPPTKYIDIDRAMHKFRERYFGHEKEAHRILRFLNGSDGGCYVVNGEAKDFFVECILEVSGTSYTRIDVTSIEDLAGTSSIYENCKLGAFGKNIKNGETIVLPDIDTITSENRHADPLNTVIKVLNTGLLKDNMIGDPIDIFGMGIKVIATISAGDVTKLSKKALSKLNVINLPTFNENEREKLCRDYIIPEKTKTLSEGTVVTISENVYNQIANQFTIGNGLFDIEANVNRLFEAVEDQTYTEINSENVIEFLGIKKWERNEYVKDLLSLKEKFMCHKPSYEEERARHISKLFKFYDEATTLERREELLNQLRVLVNILPVDHFSVDLEEVERKMNETHFNMNKAKNHILNNLTLRKNSPTAKIKPLLLYGSYGVGKTSLATAFSDQCPTIFIPCQGMTRQKLTRDIAIKLSEACTNNAVIILEELDKVSKGYDNPIHVVQSVIDGLLCLDDCNIDVSGLLIIATSNALEEISPALLSRFDLIIIEGYSLPEKKTITQNYMLPKLLNTFHAEELKFTEEAVDELMLYSPEVGMRDVEKHLTNMIGTLLRKGDKTNVVAKEVREILGEKPLPDGAPEGEFGPGTVKGMAVCCGGRGVSMTVSVTKNTRNKDDTVGRAGDSVKESAKIAKLLCEKNLGRNLPDLFVEFGDQSIKKEGSSAGLAIFVATLSFALSQAVPSNIAFTGELSIINDGLVRPVCVREKIKAAISDKGTTKIYIPYDNYVQEAEAGNLEKYDIDIVPVKHINEIINELFDLGGESNGNENEKN